MTVTHTIRMIATNKKKENIEMAVSAGVRKYLRQSGDGRKSIDPHRRAATGIFSSTGLVGIRDTFYFHFKSRGGYPSGWQANPGVSMIGSDAWLCSSGNVSIPVSGGVQ
jgi:hypothetical protein